MVEMVTSWFFGEVASRDRLRDQTAEGMCSLLCVRSRGNSGDQKIAFGSPAFCNYSLGLVLIYLLCLLAMLYPLCLLQRSLCNWRLCKLENQPQYLRCIYDVKKLWVFQLHLANLIEYRKIFVWLFKIVMMYLSLLDYHSFYDGVLETMHQRCFFKVLADVGYANARQLCIHKKRVCDVALACRRVGSKRVKVLSSSK